MRTTHSTGKSYAKGEPYRGYEPDIEEEGIEREDYMEEFLEFFDMDKDDYDECTTQDKLWEDYESYLISQKREDDAVAAFESQQEY